MKAAQTNWVEHRIDIPGRFNFLPYYTSSSWSSDERYFVFFSSLPDLSRTWICTYTPATRTITEKFELTGRDQLNPATAGNGADPMPDGSIYTLERQREEELLTAVWLPEREELLIPHCNRLLRVCLADGRQTELYTFEDPAFRLGGPGTVSRDGKLAAFGAYFPADRTPTRNLVVVIDTETGAEVGRHDFGEFFANHFQFTADPDLLLYAHEGPTRAIDDRLNLLAWRTGERRLLHRHERSAATGEIVECIGHEMVAGDRFCAVRYPDSEIRSGLLLVTPDGFTRLLVEDDCWHCAGNADGSFLVYDTMWWGHSTRKTEYQFDILRVNAATGEKELLCSVESRPQRQCMHPHPHLNAAGNRVLLIRIADDLPPRPTIMLLEQQ